MKFNYLIIVFVVLFFTLTFLLFSSDSSSNEEKTNPYEYKVLTCNGSESFTELKPTYEKMPYVQLCYIMTN